MQVHHFCFHGADLAADVDDGNPQDDNRLSLLGIRDSNAETMRGASKQS
jgi:hypothetical protein